MKNFLKTILFVTTALALFSCENSVDPLASANGFNIKSITNNSPLLLTTATNTNTVLVLEWDKSNNGVDTQEANYLIEVAAAGTNFAEPITGNLGSTINLVNGIRTYTMKVGEINDLANKLPNFSFCNQMLIDVRIVSKLGDYDSSAFFQPSSNFVTLTVTPYSTAKSQLAFVLNGANTQTATKLKSSSFTNLSDYEGYAYLQAGNYKFYQPNACGDYASPTIIGKGSTAGTLDAAGTDIVLATAGHYLIKANLSTATKTYSVKYIKAFGLFGSAKSAFGTGNAIPMDDANNNNVWKLTINLLKGKTFKFKALDWTAPLTAATPAEVPSTAVGTTIISTLGTYSAENGLTEVATGNTNEILVAGTVGTGTQKYDITIDVSNPRSYTYKVQINNN